MKPLKTRTNSQKGVVLVEFLQGATLILILSLLVMGCVLHLWTRSYLKAEAFFMARAALYGNLDSCEASTHLLSEKWTSRSYFCTGSSVHLQYKLLPKLSEKSYSGKSNIIHVSLGEFGE
ncbi:MAG: hypothetical protein R3A80_00815 [Bdellovibrionota bacterium]